MQTIFLDIDGVLHPFDSAVNLPSEAGPGSSGGTMLCWAPLLAEIIGDSEVQIVIHSTWRLRYSLAEIRDRFPESLRARIRGCTRGTGRFDGIRQYVAEHALTDFLVLDDIADFFPAGWPNLLLCAGETGISEPLVQARLRAFLAASRTK